MGPYEQRLRLVTIATLVLVGVCLLLLLFSVFDFGRLTIDVPQNTRVYVNGHLVREDSVRLRPGSYRVATTSADYFSHYETVRVKPLLGTTFDPSLTKRDPVSIITSTIGASGLYGKATLSDIARFQNNTWLTGTVGPGSPAFIALRYESGSWRVAYYDGGGSFPEDLDSLPVPIARRLAALQSRYGND